jgi:hypothetical protein
VKDDRNHTTTDAGIPYRATSTRSPSVRTDGPILLQDHNLIALNSDTSPST